MAQQIDREGSLTQPHAVETIVQKFGETYVSTNRYGNRTIRVDVLTAFRTLTADTVVWVQTTRTWRKRRRGDKHWRRQGG